jgi:hypothetical protein
MAKGSPANGITRAEQQEQEEKNLYLIAVLFLRCCFAQSDGLNVKFVEFLM